MTHRATITLDQEAYSFLLAKAHNNRSAYINELLKKEKNRQLKKDILRANEEEASDIAYQEELDKWHNTLSDGL
ncbi:type II toxin-antitoxin system MazE family antitoxin [Kordia sp.]|uniref:type II toxin-antitoxin system MazE family antitoxin n=1 Tax=Kordia sp. TaxID=1965332 RepID=UPI003D6BA7CC